MTEPGIAPQEVLDGMAYSWILLEDVARPEYYLYGKNMGLSTSGAHEWGNPANRITIQINTAACTGVKKYMNCNNNNEIYSFHAGGNAANFLFADGHVRLISDRMSGTTFRSLYTRAGLETINEADY
jgi:prepilin-type processing-associated H-X9-DG protein